MIKQIKKRLAETGIVLSLLLFITSDIIINKDIIISASISDVVENKSVDERVCIQQVSSEIKDTQLITGASFFQGYPIDEKIVVVIEESNVSITQESLEELQTEEEPEVEEETETDIEIETKYIYEGKKLNSVIGTVSGPSGKETYYNLPMDIVVKYMEDLGYNYSYWVRDDGCKMYGDYIMVATDTRRIPKGTIIETSLGLGIVCDHCESAAESNEIWLDIATIW